MRTSFACEKEMIHLAVIEGSEEKEKIELMPGQTLTIGRTAQADIVFGQDAYMSGIHFRLRNEKGTLILENLSRTNGTLVNGQWVEAAVLTAGDRIVAGRTGFLVVESAPAPSCRLQVGSWRFGKLPDGWEVMEGIGIRLVQGASFRASMIAVEEPIPQEQSLAEYIQVQRNLIQSRLEGAELSDCRPAPVQGGEQAMVMDVFSPAPDGGRICQRQLYVLSRGIVGIFTITLADNQIEQLRESQSIVVNNLSFVPN